MTNRCRKLQNVNVTEQSEFRQIVCANFLEARILRELRNFSKRIKIYHINGCDFQKHNHPDYALICPLEGFTILSHSMFGTLKPSHSASFELEPKLQPLTPGDTIIGKTSREENETLDILRGFSTTPKIFLPCVIE